MKKEGFLLAAYMVVADGEITAEEKSSLRAELEFENVDSNTVDQVYYILGEEAEAPSLNSILKKIKGYSNQDKKEILEYVLRISFVDNEFSSEEEEFFEDVCDKINYSKSNFNKLIEDLEETAKAAKMAEKFGANATEEDIHNVEDKMDGMKKGPLAKIWDKVVALWNGFNSPDTPAYMKAIIIGGLIYMVTPIDLVPDFVPVFGLLDDCGVIGIVFRQFIKVAAFGLAGAAVVKLVNISKDAIAEDLRKNNQDVQAAKIKECIDKGDYTVVKVGLYDEDGEEIGTKVYQAPEKSKDIKEGAEIFVA